MNSHSIGLYPPGYAVLAIERPLSRFRAKRLARATSRRGIDTGWTCGLDSTPRMSGKTSSSRGVTRTKAGLGAVLALALGLWIALPLGVAYGSEPVLPNLVADPPNNVLLE